MSEVDAGQLNATLTRSRRPMRSMAEMAAVLDRDAANELREVNRELRAQREQDQMTIRRLNFLLDVA